MPAPKSERLLNLLIMLLVQRRPIAKDRIRELLYPDSRPDAFEKMFERDKEELRSLGIPVEVAQLDPLFDDEFGYQRPDEPESRRRHLQPWGMVRTSGRWYLVGFDTDRGAERVFRLDRVQGGVKKVGGPRAYDVPPDTDLRETIERLAPVPAAERAVLLVRKGTGHSFRRRAARVKEGVDGPDDRTTWDCVELDRPARGLVDEVLYHGPDVVLVEPAALRAEVVARLEAVA